MGRFGKAFTGSVDNRTFFLEALLLSFLRQAPPLTVAANPFIGLLPSPLIAMKALQLIPDDDADQAIFITFNKVDLFQCTQPIFNKRLTAVQALGNELRRKGLGLGHVNLTVVIDHACHIL